jgi:hypothetical protein
LQLVIQLFLGCAFDLWLGHVLADMRLEHDRDGAGILHLVEVVLGRGFDHLFLFLFVIVNLNLGDLGIDSNGRDDLLDVHRDRRCALCIQ